MSIPQNFSWIGLGSFAIRKGLSVMDRWILEDGSESGVMFFREGTGRMSIDNGCSCALVEGSGDEMRIGKRASSLDVSYLGKISPRIRLLSTLWRNQ
jgi:hypothetical protein